MNVIFLNTWAGELHDELRAYVLKHLPSTDIFCFQEASDEDRSAYEDLFAKDFTIHTALRQNPDDQSWYGNAIYIRKTIPIKDKGALFLSPHPDYEVGIVAHVTVHINDTEATIVNVHGIPYPGDKLDTPARLYQSKTIIDTFTGLENVIIGGDFNLLPETKSVQLFAEHGYQDLISDYAIKSTRNRITYEKYPDSIQHHADYAFVSDAVKVQSFIVPETVVSDHQPLELSVAILEPERILEDINTEVYDARV